MSAAERISALEGLLARIEQRKGEPGIRLVLPFESTAAAAPAAAQAPAATPKPASAQAPAATPKTAPRAEPDAPATPKRPPADYTPHEVGGAAAGARSAQPAAPSADAPEIAVAAPPSDGPPLTVEPATRPSGYDSAEAAVSEQAEPTTKPRPPVEVAPLAPVAAAADAPARPQSTAPITQASAPASDQVETAPRGQQLPTPADERSRAELTPPPAPPPAPAIEKAVAGGVIKIEPKTIKPTLLRTDNVGEFIGDVQRMGEANFGDTVDASLDLTFA